MSKVEKASNPTCCATQHADLQENCCAKVERQNPEKEEKDVRLPGYQCC